MSDFDRHCDRNRSKLMNCDPNSDRKRSKFCNSDKNCDRNRSQVSLPIGFLAAWFWPKSRSKFGQTCNFDRNLRSKFRSNNVFDQLFGQTWIMTDCQLVKIFWPTGQKNSTDGFPTERCRSKVRSKCAISIKIWCIFDQNFDHNQWTVL